MIFLKSILVILLAVLLICVLTFIGVPVYRFAPGGSFSGKHIYNPYAGIDSAKWFKANFHAHQREKPKCNYTADEMLAVYRANGYDIMSISDHQHINRAQSDRPGFIPTYEHGFGLNRYHQLMMGAEKVSYRDYPLMLTQSQMQFMLHWLKPQTRILVLNHPGQTRIIDHEIYGRLRGYDLLEINPEQGR